jgi:ABC-type uncharacterized transport system involved in gliding motility auxiliary subunit
MSRSVIKQIGTLAGFATIPLMIVLAIGLIAVRSFEWYIILGLAVLLVAVAIFAATNPEVWQRQLGRQRVSSTISGIVVIIALVGIIVLVNVLLYRSNVQLDLTQNQNFTLTDTSAQIVQKFKTPVVANVLYDNSTQDQQQRAVDLFKQYAARNDKFTYQSINAAVDPLAVQRYEAKSNPAVIFEMGTRKQQVSSIDEQTFTRALQQLQAGTVRRVLIMSGHQELPTDFDQQGNSVSGAITALTDNNFKVELYNSINGTSSPLGSTSTGASPTPTPTNLDPANDILLIAGPRGKYSDDEIKRITSFLRQGGKALMAYDINRNVDPAQATNLNDLLTTWGVKFNRGVIIEQDPTRRTQQTPLELVPQIDTTSPLGTGLTGGNHNVVALLSTSIDKGTNTTITYSGVLTSSVNSYLKVNLQSQSAEFEQGDTRGPLTVVATVELPAADPLAPLPPTPTAAPVATTPGATPAPTATATATAAAGATKQPLNTRIVLMGTPSVFSDYGLNRSPDNTTFFINAMNWLNESTDSVVINSKVTASTPFAINDSQSTVTFWSTFLGLPLLILFLGLIFWWRRR